MIIKSNLFKGSYLIYNMKLPDTLKIRIGKGKNKGVWYIKTGSKNNSRGIPYRLEVQSDWKDETVVLLHRQI